MWDNDVIAQLTAVTLLVGFLICKQWERARKRAAFRRQFQREGEAFNVAPLRPRLATVRHDFSRLAHNHTQGIPARKVLVAAARRKLSQLPFFQNQPAPS